MVQAQGRDIENFLSRNSSRISKQTGSVGGNGDGAFAIEDEREPEAFTIIYRIALTQGKSGKFVPANRPAKIRVTELKKVLAKRVGEDRPDAGNPVFALQPMKAADETTEIALSSHIKSRKRRKRRRGKRG
jgi:hypothetical protein